jgi:hypothetical protein
MENNQQPPTSPEQTSGVWLSREEYERLQGTVQQSQGYAAPQYVNPSAPTTTSKKFTSEFWTYAGAAVALFIFVGLSFNTGSFLFIPMVIGIGIFSTLAIKSMIKPSRNAIETAMPNSIVAVKGRKMHPAAIVGLVILGLFVFLPFIPIILMILFMLIMAASGQDVRGT